MRRIFSVLVLKSFLLLVPKKRKNDILIKYHSIISAIKLSEYQDCMDAQYIHTLVFL
jgi:hypothetical protein